MNLIYDRTAEDVERALALAKKAEAGTLTDAEKAEWLAGMKGSYNATDLNRVEAAVKQLAAELNAAGYPTAVEPVLKGGSRLPSGYTQLEYIQSSGTQYIDTGYVITSENMKVVIKFAYTAAHSDATLFGSETTGITGSGEYSICPYGNPQFFVGGSKSLKSAYEPFLNEVCTLDITANNGTLTDIWNGTRQNSQSYTQSLNHTYSVAVFGNNISGAVTQKVSIKLYLFRIYDGNVLVRDYIPCKNASGTIGLYDFVGGEFYTTPTAAEAVALPEGYTQVEYLQSSGTQYIDTGFKPDQNTMIEADIAYLGTAGDNIAGVRNSSSDAINRFGLITFGSAKKIGAFFRDSSIQAITLDNKKHKYNLSKNGLYVDSILYGSSNSGSFACSYNYILFGFNNGSNGIVYTESRVYACKIYNSGTLVRNLIPAKNSSGVIGLYDIANSTFYTNAGSGTFTAGADIVGFTAGAEVGKAEDREWQTTDIIRLSQWRQYLANVQALRDAYYTLAETGELTDAEDRLDYIGANTIEKILADIDLLIGWMKSSYRRCGTFRAGNNAAHLPLKGSA